MSLGYLARIGAMCDPYAPPSAGPQTGCTPYTGPIPAALAPPSTASAWLTPVLYVGGAYVLYKLLFAKKGATP